LVEKQVENGEYVFHLLEQMKYVSFEKTDKTVAFLIFNGIVLFNNDDLSPLCFDFD
jgi:hypothetical protein